MNYNNSHGRGTLEDAPKYFHKNTCIKANVQDQHSFSYSASYKEKRLVYIDILRVIAILAVIMIHVSADGFNNRSILPHSFEWHVHAFYDAIVRFAVPVFIMITGALYGDPSEDVSFERIYKKNISRLVCALAFWYVIFLKFHIKNYVLWFLFLCIGLYMLIPFLRMITASEKMMKHFIILSLIFSYALPQFFDLPIWNEGGGRIVTTVRWIKDGFYGHYWGHLGFGYYSYFVIGYACSKVKITMELLKKVAMAGICGFAYTILMTGVCSYVWDVKYKNFYYSLSLNVLAEAIFVFILCRWIAENVQFTHNTLVIMAKMADLVFGVYLVHMIVLRRLSAVIHPLKYNPVWMDIVMVLMIFSISCAISALIHKIPVLRKYIV